MTKTFKARSHSNDGISIIVITDTSKCDTVAKLTDKIGDYIAWQVRHSGGVTVNNLNKRFSRAATKLGTSVKAIVGDLEASGEIRVFMWHNRVILVDSAWCADQEAVLDGTELLEARDRMFSRVEA